VRANFQVQNDDKQYTAWVSRNFTRHVLRVRARSLTLLLLDSS
jgi:hypothetical protein